MSPQHCLAICQQLFSSAKRIVVAWSGGLDSTVLLHALLHNVDVSKIVALHINHDSNDSADDWQQYCLNQAKRWSIVCYALPIPDTEKKDETSLRNARYQIFERFLEKGDLLLQAHHQQDQLETLLFRLFRGNDLAALQSIPQRRDVGKGVLFRPFLQLPKQCISDYAKLHHLSWVEDDSNNDTYYSRNYIRKQVLPIILERWQQLPNSMESLIQQLKQSNELLALKAQDDLKQCDLREETIGSSLNFERLQQRRKSEQHNLLGYWLKSQTGQFVGNSMIKVTMDKIMQCSCYRWKSGSLYHSNQRLYFIPHIPKELNSTEYHLESINKTWSLDNWIDVEFAQMPPYPLKVIRRHGGERCQPLRRNHSQTLKKLFQEYKVAPWLRDITPVFYHQNKIVAVGDIFRCDAAMPTIKINYRRA